MSTEDLEVASPAATQGLGARGASMLRRALAGARDAIVPPLCLACSMPLTDADSLCGPCWRRIDFIRPPLCDRLGIPLSFSLGDGPQLSAAAIADPPAYGRARAVARFDGAMRDLVHGFKYADRHDAGRLFGRWLAEAGRDVLADADALVPVPLARWRLFNRRYNQAAMLALEVARVTGIAYVPSALRRARATRSQVGLTPAQRRRNVAGAFAVPPGHRSAIEGRAIVIVDDVITTGATLDACARALLAAGATRVDAIALAIAIDGRRTA